MTSEEDPNDLDILMSKSGDELKKLTDQDLQRIIDYQRKMRKARADGVKTKKAPSGPAPKLDLSTIMNKPAIQSSTFRRRV